MTVVALSQDDIDPSLLRLIAHRVLEDSVGSYSGTEDIFDDVEIELPTVDLGDLRSDEIEIISGMWGQSRTSGYDRFVAYSLGFDCWYVFHTNAADEVELDSIVREAEREPAFASIAKRWIHECGPSSGGFPTEFSSLYQREPWFIRELANALAGNEGRAVETIATELLDLDDLSDVDRASIREVWQAAVACDRERNAEEIPGLAEVPGDASDRLFDAWVQQVTLRWVDTAGPIDHDTAHRLRLACQFIGLAA